jgi:hypothetical protein
MPCISERYLPSLDRSGGDKIKPDGTTGISRTMDTECFEYDCRWGNLFYGSRAGISAAGIDQENQ